MCQKEYHRLAHHFAQKRDNYLPSYRHKTIFYVSLAITIIFTSSFAAAIDKVGVIIKSELLGYGSPLLAGSNMQILREPGIMTEQRSIRPPFVRTKVSGVLLQNHHHGWQFA